MDIHENARLTPCGRALLVHRILELGETPTAVATAVGVSPNTARKLVAHFQAEGPDGLRDRSSRPHRLRQETSQATQKRIVAPLRRQRFSRQQIARDVGVSPATVSHVLKRAGISRLRDCASAPGSNR
jgi:transposase